MEYFAVGGADTQCLCGEPAGVFANASIDPSGKNWVLQLGSMSIALDVCIDGVHCALSCGSPGPPPPPPTGGLQLGAGIQSQDPNENPTFATFNQAELSLCDGALLMSDRAHYRTPSNASLPAPGYPFPVRPSLHFNGLRILNASLLKLAKLGLAKAENVILTGVGHGGTAAILHADRIGKMLKALAPNLKTYGLLAADGYHPRHRTDEFITIKPSIDTGNPYDTILRGIANVSNAAAGMSVGCRAKLGPAQQWRCLYVNESMPFITTPTFLVQQLASFWDTACILDGGIIGLDQGRDAMLQLKCRKSGIWEICFQYARRCNPEQVSLAIIPYQQQYVREMTPLLSRSGNGGFLHSCHLGGYWETAAQRWADNQYKPPQPFKPQRPASWPAGFNTSSYWKQLAIGGTTMQQSVTQWWTQLHQGHQEGGKRRQEGGGAPQPSAALLHVDCVWPNQSWYPYCNPTCNGWGWY